MRICHVTPHLPPDQAANALLPFHLGAWARASGDSCRFVAHEPRQASRSAAEGLSYPGPVTWIPAPARPGGRLAKRLSSMAAAVAIARRAAPSIADAELVHVHSNGLLPEVGAWLARRRRKPVVLTLYGTEIWHYAARRPRPDLFTRAYGGAAQVTFYSQGLMDRAFELGLARPNLSVVYPPVAAEFQPFGDADRLAARAALGLGVAPLLVNVKRLHPLASQATLLRAMPRILRAFPAAQLVICGSGPLAGELTSLAASLGVSRAVGFAGLVDNPTVARYDLAADLFVLPSILEACPTVALEALACGTPVVSADNPGGVELNRLFGDDVRVVPRENADALADAVIERLEARARVQAATRERVERDFRPAAVARRYRAIYDEAIASCTVGRRR
jgi:glycosyltransferase involved in cell wall biosynthesis